MDLHIQRMLTATIVSCATVAVSASAGAAVITYGFSSGVGAAEAEDFTTRVHRDAPGRDPEAWVTVTDGDANDVFVASPNTPNGGKSGGKFVASLPNNGVYDGFTLDNVPYVEYRFLVTAADTGTYNLYARLAALSNADNSIYYQIYKEGDSPASGPNSQYINIAVTGSKAFNYYLANTFNLDTAGAYMVRFNARDDGTGFDKLVLQKSNFAAPTGFGPDVTPIPEPASITAIAAGAMLLRRRRRDA